MKRSRLRGSNPARRARLFRRNYGGPAYRAAIVALPCCACGREGSEPAHETARGMGGCGGSAKDLVPLCHDCHSLYDTRPWEFERLFPWLDLKEIAASLWQQYGHLAVEL